MPDNRQAIVNRLIILLRQERIRQGLSLTEVAVRAGIDRTMVMRVEEGERMATIYTLLGIANALDINLATFLHRAQKVARN